MTPQADQPVPADARPAFLDVPALLESSRVRPPMPRLRLFLLAVFVTMFVSSAMSAGQAGNLRGLIEAGSTLLVMALVGGLLVTSTVMVRRLRAEQLAVERVAELIQLRQWAEAAGRLDRYLSAPARTPGLRAQALIYLASVLGRYQRFADVVTVYEHLLDSGIMDAGATYGLRLGRALAVLREDRLVDADRAITELRRSGPAASDAAGFGLLELYRDVKTGHADDAVVRFEKLLPTFRSKLGHRSADAWALVARAYDILGRGAEAAAAYANATLLAPPPELFRRYPEVRALEGKYEPSYAPTEAA